LWAQHRTDGTDCSSLLANDAVGSSDEDQAEVIPDDCDEHLPDE